MITRFFPGLHSVADRWKTLWIPGVPARAVWKFLKAVENSECFSGKLGGKVPVKFLPVFHSRNKWICSKPGSGPLTVENCRKTGSSTGADQLSRIFFTISSTVSLKWVSSRIRLSTWPMA